MGHRRKSGSRKERKSNYKIHSKCRSETSPTGRLRPLYLIVNKQRIASASSFRVMIIIYQKKKIGKKFWHDKCADIHTRYFVKKTSNIYIKESNFYALTRICLTVDSKHCGTEFAVKESLALDFIFFLWGTRRVRNHLYFCYETWRTLDGGRMVWWL
jgi:hypothetical protein